MGDPHDVKSKSPYHTWSEPESKALLRLLGDAINLGFRDSIGSFNKLTVETRILPALNQMLGTDKNYAQFRNRMKSLKNRYNNLSNLLRFSSGFGWDSVTKKFTAPDEVWNDYFVAHPNHKHMRDDSFEDFEDLRMVFGSNIAIGQNAMGLGDPINADTYQVEENAGTNDSNYVQVMDNGDGITYGRTFDNVVFSSLEKSMCAKLPQRKKARTDASNSIKNFVEVTEIGHRIFGMIQKDGKRKTEEKEAEDKANNVWDAIKEIPDLDEDLRYEAMTLVHSLDMKSGFVNISIAERNGWIQRSLRRPIP